ncbi:3-hydroxyacyl-CoA dehydrogenase [Vibrio sp. CAU 1672]|uniref:3-hydroxyacyl-CoA dehydrogenase n=1 Tax=Vibrio sp. CAU 1672 TaxID=3032594 RepID=UPI0023DBD35D|nr:3-hydroxyacyl-CoA dehydrogenase [Vibrio sp. CAU 1672]MDF2154592.1 3-hydroxyacyl-CoA dehydrogenase [Vibrio sp. CAU 1672]
MEYRIQTVAVIGAGTMGAGIAQVAAQSGYQVVLFDVQPGKAAQTKDDIAVRMEKRVARGKMTRDAQQALLGALHCSDALGDVAGADLVIEAIVEDLAIKQSLFRDLEAICRDDCLLATNTSSISVTSIASALARPERFVGLHFFNPAPLMKLVEVVRGIATAASVSEAAQAWAQSCDKHAVVTRSIPGFIVNRVARPFYAEGLRALETSVAEVQDIDHLITQAGQFNMGPFELMDLIGHDVNYAVTKSVYDAYYQDKRFLPSLTQKELVEAGYLGRKSGRGFYSYADAATRPAVNLASKRALPQDLPVSLHGDWRVTPSLPELVGLTTSAGDDGDAPFNQPHLNIDGTYVLLTFGMTASDLSAQLDRPVVVFDYCQDYGSSEVIAIAPALQNSQANTDAVIAYFQSKGKQVLVLDDYPGLILWRTWTMLINEALDLVNQNGASTADVDVAMKSGVNYPLGPIEQGGRLGWPRLLDTLTHLQAFYGEERYRPSPLLRRFAIQYQRGEL